MSSLTLTSFAALLEPFTDFVTSVVWYDGQPVEMLLHDDAMRHFGADWYPDHPVWELFDALDVLGLTYGFSAAPVVSEEDL